MVKVKRTEGRLLGDSVLPSGGGPVEGKRRRGIPRTPLGMNADITTGGEILHLISFFNCNMPWAHVHLLALRYFKRGRLHTAQGSALKLLFF